jgi:hypothetical protein
VNWIAVDPGLDGAIAAMCDGENLPESAEEADNIPF